MLRIGRKTFLPIQGLCYTHGEDVKKSDRINSHSPGSLTGMCDDSRQGILAQFGVTLRLKRGRRLPVLIL